MWNTWIEPMPPPAAVGTSAFNTRGSKNKKKKRPSLNDSRRTRSPIASAKQQSLRGDPAARAAYVSPLPPPPPPPPPLTHPQSQRQRNQPNKPLPIYVPPSTTTNSTPTSRKKKPAAQLPRLRIPPRSAPLPPPEGRQAETSLMPSRNNSPEQARLQPWLGGISSSNK